jgi:hypothetical protein
MRIATDPASRLRAGAPFQQAGAIEIGSRIRPIRMFQSAIAYREADGNGPVSQSLSALAQDHHQNPHPGHTGLTETAGRNRAPAVGHAAP